MARQQNDETNDDGSTDVLASKMLKALEERQEVFEQAFLTIKQEEQEANKSSED